MILSERMRMKETFFMHSAVPFPLAIDHGKGAALYDTEGKRYLDFFDSQNILGYGNEDYAEALLDQALRLGANPGYHAPALELGQQLCLRSGMSRVCLCDSGSAANEAMITLARRYSHQRYGAGRHTILTLRGAAHGQSLATLAASGAALPELAAMDHGFLPVAPEISALRQVQAPVCAIMVELISLTQGVKARAKQFIHELAVLCAERDWLLLIDEVQSGIGRTGSLFAFQQYGILPDAVSFGRSIAAGLPMGGILTNSRCSGVLQDGFPAAQEQPSPICIAAALSTLAILNETALDEVSKKGDYLKSGIETLGLGALGDMRGSGLMMAVEILGNASHSAARLAEQGLLAQEQGGALCLLPPLLVTHSEIDDALNIMKAVLAYDSFHPGNFTQGETRTPAYFN